MNVETRVLQSAVGAAQLSFEDRWIRVELSLGSVYRGGEIARPAPGVECRIEPVGKRAAKYLDENWLSGIMSGAFYAFRTLKMQRRHVDVHAFVGRLTSADMDAVANAAALVIAGLANAELPGLQLDGWKRTNDESVLLVDPSLRAELLAVPGPPNPADIVGVINSLGVVIVSNAPPRMNDEKTGIWKWSPEPDTADAE